MVCIFSDETTLSDFVMHSDDALPSTSAIHNGLCIKLQKNLYFIFMRTYMFELFLIQRSYKLKFCWLINFRLVRSATDVVFVPSDLSSYRTRIDASVDEQRKYRQVLAGLSNKVSCVQLY